MTLQQESALIVAALEVLQAHGLPHTCLTGPVQWTGTRRRQEALYHLHCALNDALPPLPGHVGHTMPDFVYAPPSDNTPTDNNAPVPESELLRACQAAQAYMKGFPDSPTWEEVETLLDTVLASADGRAG